MASSAQVEIGLVIYPTAQQAAVLGLTDLLTLAGSKSALRHGLAANPVRVTHWQPTGPDAPPTLVFDSQPGTAPNPAVIIIPPTLGEPVDNQAASAFVPWLQASHGEGKVLGSVCTGTFLLAETGLLGGRRATVHWALVDAFETRFPGVAVDSDQLLIDDTDIITASGLMGWTDLGLWIVDRFLGTGAMIETAQVLLLDLPGREQRYYSAFSPRLTHGDAAILKVQQWLQATGAKDIALPVLATRANLEERTFLRRFQKATGMTSSEYCQRLRVGVARSLLQLGPTSIERIAWEVGYADAGAFRKIFTRIVGLSPGEYRRRFHVAMPEKRAPEHQAAEHQAL